jgi:hypothetical protein
MGGLLYREVLGRLGVFGLEVGEFFWFLDDWFGGRAGLVFRFHAADAWGMSTSPLQPPGNPF